MADGCHMPIKQPVGNAVDFLNRKVFHSIILQGELCQNIIFYDNAMTRICLLTCDEYGKFIDCFIGMPGGMHGARVFRNSPLFQNIKIEVVPLIPPNYHIIGYSAYPLMVNLMVPYKDNGYLSQAQTTYNVKLSVARSIIERAFGRLKRKFRRLKY